jgi:hypothetical protein
LFRIAVRERCNKVGPFSVPFSEAWWWPGRPG